MQYCRNNNNFELQDFNDVSTIAHNRRKCNNDLIVTFLNLRYIAFCNNFEFKRFNDDRRLRNIKKKEKWTRRFPAHFISFD